MLSINNRTQKKSLSFSQLSRDRQGFISMYMKRMILSHFYSATLSRGTTVCLISNKNNMDMYHKTGITHINKSISENLKIKPATTKLSRIEKIFREKQKIIPIWMDDFYQSELTRLVDGLKNRYKYMTTCMLSIQCIFSWKRFRHIYNGYKKVISRSLACHDFINLLTKKLSLLTCMFLWIIPLK